MTRVFTVMLALWGARAVRARAQAPEQRAWPGRGQGEAHLEIPAAVNVTALGGSGRGQRDGTPYLSVEDVRVRDRVRYVCESEFRSVLSER